MRDHEILRNFDDTTVTKEGGLQNFEILKFSILPVEGLKVEQKTNIIEDDFDLDIFFQPQNYGAKAKNIKIIGTALIEKPDSEDEDAPKTPEQTPIEFTLPV